MKKPFQPNSPYLNIVFIRPDPITNEGFERPISIRIDTTIDQIKKTHISALIEIKPSYTIADVEEEFGRRFGLVVEILRKSDTHWIKPSGTNNLTLQEQNELGRTTSEHIIHPDYDTKIEKSEN